MSTNAQPANQEGHDAVSAFIRAGRHLTPSGSSITLNTFKKQFAHCGFVPRPILATHFPDIERAMCAASMARFLAGG